MALLYLFILHGGIPRQALICSYVYVGEDWRGLARTGVIGLSRPAIFRIRETSVVLRSGHDTRRTSMHVICMYSTVGFVRNVWNHSLAGREQLTNHSSCIRYTVFDRVFSFILFVCPFTHQMSIISRIASGSETNRE